MRRRQRRFSYCSIVAEASRREALSWQKSTQGDFCYIRFADCEDAKAFSELFECYFLRTNESFTVFVPIVVGTAYK